MDKIFRIGHRTPKMGVITIASRIIEDTIFYGASYCSPKEKQYDKKMGVKLAQDQLEKNIAANNYIELVQLKHAMVIQQIIMDILTSNECPDWAEGLLLEQYYYPSGLMRYSSKRSHPPIEVGKITVNNEYTKSQLLMALDYMHHLKNLDTDFIIVNLLTHLYHNPDLIVVE